MAIAITVEPETADGSGMQFRLSVNGRVVATGLTVCEAHFAVSEVLLRIAYPESAGLEGRARSATARPRLPRASMLRPVAA